MQRISFKQAVGLALVVTSISLMPTAIGQTDPGMGPGEGVVNSTDESVIQTPEAAQQDGSETPDDQERPAGDSGLNDTETIERLRNELEDLKEDLKQSAQGPALFGINIEILIAAAALLVSVVSILVSWFLFQTLDQDIKRIKTSLRNFDQQIRLKFGGIETEQERLTAQLKADVQSVQKKQDFFEATSSLKSQPSFQTPAGTSSPFTTQGAAVVPDNSPPSRSIPELIRAVNSGDRQALRDATAAELNITNDSENAIAMGMSQATVLEEVAGGGSYLLVNLQGRNLLFPTDRTLRSFSTTQPNKGLYSYEQRSVAKAEILEPAVLEKNGSSWRVSQIGKVAVP